MSNDLTSSRSHRRLRARKLTRLIRALANATEQTLRAARGGSQLLTDVWPPPSPPQPACRVRFLRNPWPEVTLLTRVLDDEKVGGAWRRRDNATSR